MTSCINPNLFYLADQHFDCIDDLPRVIEGNIIGTEEYDNGFRIESSRLCDEVVHDLLDKRPLLVVRPKSDSILDLARAKSDIYKFQVSSNYQQRNQIHVTVFLDIDRLHNALQTGSAIPFRQKLFDHLDYNFERPKETVNDMENEFSKFMESPNPAPELEDGEVFEYAPASPDFKLFDFQKRKVAWMSEIENEILQSGAINFHQTTYACHYGNCIRLSSAITADLDNGCFVQTEDCIVEKSQWYRGGCIFDEPGLGKTATIISRCLQDRLTGETPTAPTLIICPSETCHHWKREIGRVDPRAVSVIISSKKSLNSIFKTGNITSTHYVIISDSYAKFGSDERPHDMRSLDDLYKCILKERCFVEGVHSNKVIPFHDYKWRRTIVDEAHVLHSQTETVCFVRNLDTDFVWLVTGTPSYAFAFSESRSVTQFVFFMQMLERPNDILDEDDITAEAIRDVRCKICTRETKETVKNEIEILAPTESILWLQFNDDERFAYDIKRNLDNGVLMNACLQPTVPSIIESRTVSSNHEAISLLRSENEILEMVLNEQLKVLRFEITRFTDPPTELIELMESAEGSLASAQNVRSYLANIHSGSESTTSTCSICLSCFDLECTTLGMTPCGHTFCWLCGVQWASEQMRCAECRAYAPVTSLVRIMTSNTGACNDTPELTKNISLYGTKLAQLVEYINRHADEKIVVFARSEITLRNICRVLSSVNIKYERCYGTEESRVKAILSFTTPTNAHNIFVLSPDHMCRGIPFTTCTKVIFIEHYYVTFRTKMILEEMVLARIRHLAQKKRPEVIRMILRDTIEEENYSSISASMTELA